MEGRRIHNYKEMMQEQKLPELMTAYVQSVVDAHGSEVFRACLFGRQDGRLFGTLNSVDDNQVKHTSSLGNFYPDQKEFREDGSEKKVQIDMLGKLINACIFDDLKDQQQVKETVPAIGAALADSLAQYPPFEELVKKITADVVEAELATLKAVKPEDLNKYVLQSNNLIPLAPLFNSLIKKLEEESFRAALQDTLIQKPEENVNDAQTDLRSEALRFLAGLKNNPEENVNDVQADLRPEVLQLLATLKDSLIENVEQKIIEPRPLVRNFVLGQMIYFSLLPVMDARTAEIMQKDWVLSENVQKGLQAKIDHESSKPTVAMSKKDRKDKDLIAHLHKQLEAEKQWQVKLQGGANVKKKDAQDMAASFATAKAYDHEVGMRNLQNFGFKSADERPQAKAQEAANQQVHRPPLSATAAAIKAQAAMKVGEVVAEYEEKNAPAKRAVTDSGVARPKMGFTLRAKSDQPKASKAPESDAPFGKNIPHHNVESNPFGNIPLHTEAKRPLSTNAELAKKMNPSAPLEAAKSVVAAAPSASEPASPKAGGGGMQAMHDAFAKKYSSEESLEEKNEEAGPKISPRST